MSVPFEEDAGLKLSRYSGEFSNRETEQRFRAEQHPEIVRQAQILFAVAAGFSVLLLTLNLLLPPDPETVLDVIAPRSAAILASLASFFAIGQLEQRYVGPLILTWAVVIAVSSTLLIGIQTHLSIVPVLALPAIYYLALPTHLRTTIVVGVASTILLDVAYVASGPSQDLAMRVVAASVLLNILLIAMRNMSNRRLRIVWAQSHAYRRALSQLAESRHMMERIFKAVPIPLVITSRASGTITRANEAAEQFVGVAEGQLTGRMTGDFIQDPTLRDKMAREIVKTGLIRGAPMEIVRADGEVRSVMASAALMEDDGNDDITVITGVIDVTDQIEQQRQIRAAEREYRELFENAVVGIYRSRPDGKMLRANPALVRFNGYDTEAELISAVNDISDEWYVDPGRRNEWLRLMRENGRVTDFVSEVFRHKTRERVWISENSWTEYDADGKPLFFEGTLVEATDRKRLEEKIEHMALHDQLTSLGNRRLLEERLRQACARAQRYGGYFSLMYLDLDRFKAVNDAFGHASGDQLLQKVAERLKAACRAEDTIARTGGDEFAILSVGIGYPARLSLVAERIIASLSDPFELDGPPVAVGISIGIAIAPIDGVEPKDLMAKADEALYRAKEDGRNQYRFFNESIVARAQNAPLLLEKNRA